MYEKTTLNYIKLFLIVVIFCAIISLIFKGITLVKNSSFRDKSFNVLLLDKNAYLVHIETGENAINILKIDNARSVLLGKSRLAQSLILGKFIDASITSENKSNFDNIENNFISFGKFLSLASNTNQNKRDNLNEYDLFKIYINSKLTPKSSKEFKEIKKMSKDGYEADNLDIFEFADPDIFNGKISVQVLNGTDINGFATKVGTVLQSLGYNVVETGSTSETKSSVESGSESQAVGRLAAFLRIPLITKSEPGIADIKLILGEDLVKKNKL